jgi:uncharacterized lipoprotein YmbA
MIAGRVACVTCILLAITACSIGKPVKQATTYVVEVPPPQVTSSAGRRSETLRMGKVRVAAAYAGTALIYRMDDVRLTSDPYSAFIADPGTMLGDQMAAWLDRVGPYRTVARPESAQTSSCVLEATITELYGDFRPGKVPAAVLAMQFTLIDQTGTRPKAMLERAIARRVEIPRASPDALVRGYGEALAALLSELREDLQEAHEPGNVR